MINLRVNNIDVLINKYNNILVQDNKSAYEFVQLFDGAKDLYIGNNKITDKNYYVIDLTTYEKLNIEKSFIKDSLFYNYIILRLQNISDAKKNIMFNRLKAVVESKIKSYEINEDFTKLINSVFTFKSDVTIRQMLIYILKFTGKVVILLYSSAMVGEIRVKQDNIYLFDLNQNQNLSKYNLMFIDELMEFNYKTLITNINYVLPYKISNNFKSIIAKYFGCYFAQKKFIIYSREELIVCYIISKLYNLNQTINYPNGLINDNVIKSILIN